MILKVIRNLVGISLIAVLFYFVLIQLEENLIYNFLIPQAGMTIEQWLEAFRRMGVIGIGVSWLAALSWYVSAQWFFKVNSFKEAGKRVVWALHFLFPVIAIVITILLIPKAQEGSYLSYFILFINGILSYYLSTLLFSPSSFKYAPPLARVFRRW